MQSVYGLSLFVRTVLSWPNLYENWNIQLKKSLTDTEAIIVATEQASCVIVYARRTRCKHSSWGQDVGNLGFIFVYTVECRYNAVQFITISHTAL